MPWLVEFPDLPLQNVESSEASDCLGGCNGDCLVSVSSDCLGVHVEGLGELFFKKLEVDFKFLPL